ncbi:MAG: DUF3078 domain-containing protein [Candidatus Cryptobacteroides sp.]
MKTLRFYALAALLMLAAFPLSAQNEQTDKKEVQSAADVAAAAAAAFAQTQVPQAAPPKPKYWTKSAQTSLSFSQQKLSNWAGGGVNNVTLNAAFRGYANFNKGKTYWNNTMECDYGFLYQQDMPFIQKNLDRVYLTSVCGYSKSQKFGLSAKFDFLSQFTNTYTYNYPSSFEGEKPGAKDWKNARTIRSGFLSPAYAHLGLGFDIVPNPANRWLVINFSPVTGGFTVVTDEELRRAYGNHRRKDYSDESQFPYTEVLPDGSTVNHGEYYKVTRFELGAQLDMNVSLRINSSFSYSGTLILFSNYLDNPLNMRVNFNSEINWRLAAHLSMTLKSFLVYDDKVMIKKADDLDKYPDGKQRIQIQELLGITFTYSFPIPKK